MINSLTTRLQPRLAQFTTDPAQGQVASDDAPALRLGRTIALGLVATLSMAVGSLYGGMTFETHLPGAWFFGMPGGLLGSIGSDSMHPPLLAVFAVYGGLILLTRVWIGLLRHLRHHHGVPIRKVILVVAIWAVPFMLAPPLFSGDVYSYAGQGEMVSHHINPYDYGTGVLGSTPFSSMPASVWTNSPSPYGPTFLAFDGALTAASGHKILPDIMLLRLLELAGLALIVAATPSLARALGRDPAEAILLGAGSPLALTTLISGAHNDALMIGLLMAGLALARRFGAVPGIVLCAVAAGVKAPAVAGRGVPGMVVGRAGGLGPAAGGPYPGGAPHRFVHLRDHHGHHRSRLGLGAQQHGGRSCLHVCDPHRCGLPACLTWRARS